MSTPSRNPSSPPNTEPWNHNIHYHPLILDAVPSTAGRVLDVGCGEGTLTRELGTRVADVTGIDVDASSIDLARRTTAAPNVNYVQSDVLVAPFRPESFDAIVSVAALHHLEMSAGLTQMVSLLRPGGVLAVVGLARSRPVLDLPRDLAAAVGTRVLRRNRRYWEHSAPMVWPPPETFSGCCRIAESTLPGVRYRRLLLWRYSLVWTKPAR